MVRKKTKDQTSLFEDGISVREQVKALLGYMTKGIYEKEHIMAMALLSAIAGESIFLLGPPGTAKSMVARRLKMIFKDAEAFEYLMSRFSTPDEVFGPVSISKLKNEDRYERLTKGYLPSSTIVFLDEIWKAGPSIQNALLTAINEHFFQNGAQTIKLPMKALIAASNELPAEDEGLEALWDRFLVREVSNCISSESTFYKMIRQKQTEDIVIPESLLITDAIYVEWQKNIEDIEIPDNICHLVTSVRKQLASKMKEEGVGPLDYYISDRRWRKVFHLMQASAFLNGRSAIDISDTSILFHTLWNKVECIPDVLKFVSSAYTADISKGIESNQNALDKLIKQMAKALPANNVRIPDAEDEYEIVNYFYYKLEGYPNKTCLFAKADYKYINLNTYTRGLMYYADKRQCWIVHAIYSEAPFDYKMTASKVVKVNLKQCMGGVIIDNTPYAFKRRIPSRTQTAFEQLNEDMNPSNKASSVDIIEAEVIHLDEELKRRVCEFKEMKNLFMSDDDRKLILRQFDGVTKQMNELKVKVDNTKMLI